MDTKYTIKIKCANSWYSVTKQGMMTYQNRYSDTIPLIEFHSKDDAIEYLNKLFISAHKHAKCISSTNKNSNRRVLYGYIADKYKNNSVLMTLINAKLDKNHTNLITDNIYSAPGVRILIVHETEYRVG